MYVYNEKKNIVFKIVFNSKAHQNMHVVDTYQPNVQQNEQSQVQASKFKSFSHC